MATITFPNYTQIPSRIPVAVWHGLRVASIAGALIVAGLLIAVPKTGLFVMWKVVIPSLPALFLIAPGLWRNLCPLAASNQTPRALGITLTKMDPDSIALNERLFPRAQRFASIFQLQTYAGPDGGRLRIAPIPDTMRQT